MPSACSATKDWIVSGRSAAPTQAAAIRAIAAGSSRAERQHGRGPARLQHAGEAGGLAALLVAQGAEAEHPLRGEVVGQVLQQRQRLPVGPVQVLEHEQAPGIRGQHAQQPQHRLAQVDQRLVARGRLRLPPLGNQPAQRGPERVQFGADREPARAPGRHQRLGERPERRRDAPGHRPPGQDREPARAGRAGGLADQPRLPDPGFAGQQHRAAVPRLAPPPGQPADGRSPRPAPPAPGTAPAAHDQYRLPRPGRTAVASDDGAAIPHCTLASECAHHTGRARTTIPGLAPVLIGAPFWSFWWDGVRRASLYLASASATPCSRVRIVAEARWCRSDRSESGRSSSGDS